MSAFHETCRKVAEAYKAWDIDQIMALRAPECTTQLCPSTFCPDSQVDRIVEPLLSASIGLPKMENAAYEAFQRKIRPAFKTLNVEILEMIEDTENKKMAFWAKANGETVVGEYSNEYMFVFHMNKEGDKVTQLREFVDSAFMKEFSPKLQKVLGGEKPE